MDLPEKLLFGVKGKHWIVLLTVLAISCPRMAFADAADDYNSAITFYNKMRWDYAARQFETFLKNHPTHEKAPLANFFLGLSYVNLQEYKKAREVLRDFAKAQPTNTRIAQARYRVAECSYLLDDLPAALPELKEFLEKHPQDPLVERALPYLGDVQLRSNQADAALATFDKALKEAPKGPLVDDARFGRAKALESLKQDAEAIKQYQELAANKESPRAAEAQFQIGAKHFDSKQFAEATVAYLDLLMNFPKSPLAAAARLNAGYALYQQGKFPQAAQQFAAAQKDPQNSITAGYWRGLSLKSQGEYQQAAAVLADAAKEAADLPAAEAIQFQRGVCARQLGDAAAALDFFTKTADKWPQGEYADDCLHAAAELALDGGDASKANALLTRFHKDYPGSGLRLHADLLQGRLDLSNASAGVKAGKPATEIAGHYGLAGEKFDKVLKESTVPRTQQLARYYLGLTRQLQNQPEEALKVLAPLVEAVQADGAKSEFGDVLLVQAECQLALKQYDAAQATAEKYVELYPKGRQLPRALFVIAVAAGNRDDAAKSTAALERLTKDFRMHPVTPTALLQLAELADGKQDWPTSAARYTSLIALSEGTDNQAFALRGLAWSLFKQKKYAEAAQQFDRVVKQFPKHKLNSECTYYLGEAYREAGQPEKALPVFQDVFARFSPEGVATPGAEQEAPLIYAYRGGLQKARTLRSLKQVPKADEAYSALLTKFPKPQHLDRLLDEWALMNYEAENYERSDELFRRLIQDAPTSELVDDAKLSLAESDLLSDKLDDSKKAFEELLASNSSDANVKERALYQLIVLAVDQQRWADVRTLSDRMTREFPNSPHVVYAQYSEAEGIISNPKASDADLNAARQKLESVMKSAEKGLGKDAFQGRAWVLLAEINFRAKKYDEVYRLAEDLKQTLPDSIFLYQIEEVVGRSRKQEPNFPEARAAFQRVLDDKNAFRTPTAAKAQLLLAETYFLEEKWEDAFLAYQKVIANYDLPEWQSAALLQSAKCDEKMQQWKDAVKSYEQLLKDFPESEYVKEAKERLEAAKAKAGG